MTTPNEAARAALAERTRIIRDTDAEIRRLLRLAARDVTAILAAQPTDYQRWYLPQIEQQIRAALARFGGEVADEAAAGQLAAWRGGMALTDSVLRAGNLVRELMPVIDDRQLRAMTQFLTTRIRDVTVGAADAINSQLGLVLIGSQNPFDAVKGVQAILQESTTARAGTIVRTELGRAYSSANQARMMQASEVAPDLQKKWVSSGKLHPRVAHAVINGQTQPVAKPFLLHGGRVKIMYPNDPAAPAAETINCGCVSVPVVPSWKSMVPEEDRDAVAVSKVL